MKRRHEVDWDMVFYLFCNFIMVATLTFFSGYLVLLLCGVV